MATSETAWKVLLSRTSFGGPKKNVRSREAIDGAVKLETNALKIPLSRGDAPHREIPMVSAVLGR